MLTLTQPRPNSRCSIFTEDSTCFDIFPVLWATSLSPTSSIQCRLVCLTTSRRGYSTSWRCTKCSTSTMQAGYPCLLTTTSHQKISHKEVSQCNGKKMNGMSCDLLLVVTQSLRGGSPAQRSTVNRAIECTHALLEFYMYAWYKTHNNATFSYMEDTWYYFHTFKDVFLLGRAGKKTNAKANALRIELVKEQKVDEQIKAETCTPSKKQRKMNARCDYISHEIDVSKDLYAVFNFRMIHWMSYWVKQIRRYGALQQYSAKRHEQ